MARLPRYVVPGQPQHVIQRGNNRSALFIAPEDYLYFHECLADACRRYACEVHAYVLMTNHVHLVLTPHTPTGISKAMQSVGGRYVRYFNVAYRRTGTLCEGRYRATIIDTDRYLLQCCRYVELNPVRAGMVRHPTEYLWSSHRANALGVPDALASPHAAYRALAADDAGRQAAYRALFTAAMDGSALDAIRDATNYAWALGSDRFREEIAAVTGRRAHPLYHVAPTATTASGALGE